MLELDFSLLLRGQYHETLAAGPLLSLELAVITLASVVSLAILAALLRLAPFRALQWLGFAYTENIRNIPLLAHVLFWCFAAPEWLPEDLKAWLYVGNIRVASAIVALTLYTAAFMSEDMRSDICTVPTVQPEAAHVLSFGHPVSIRLVILPQTSQTTVPPLILQTLNLWKNTSIATMIDVVELIYQAGQVESLTFHSLESFAFTTMAYLDISLLIIGAAARYQQRYPRVRQ